jgi:membrane protein
MDAPTQPEVPESASNQSNPTVVHGKRWLMDLFPNLRDAGMRWTEDDAGSLAASVAYYLALSLFPMLLLLTSGIGLFLRFTHTGKDAEQQILATVEIYASPAVKEHIEQLLKQLTHHSLVSGPFGIVMAIMAAIGVFAQIDRGFDKIFRIAVRREKSVSKTVVRVVHHRLSAFLMLVALGGLIVVLFAASMVIAQFRSLTGASMPSLKHVFNAVEVISTVIANAMLFTLIYRTLPKRRVLWRDALRGGLLAAIVWELGRDILGMFLIGMRYTTAYGVIGSFIALLLWCYYGISIIFFGAEYVQVLEVRRQSRRESTHSGALNGRSSVGTVAKVIEQGETLASSALAEGNRPADDSGTQLDDDRTTSTRNGVARPRTRPRRSSGETKNA